MLFEKFTPTNKHKANLFDCGDIFHPPQQVCKFTSNFPVRKEIDVSMFIFLALMKAKCCAAWRLWVRCRHRKWFLNWFGNDLKAVSISSTLASIIGVGRYLTLPLNLRIWSDVTHLKTSSDKQKFEIPTARFKRNHWFSVLIFFCFRHPRQLRDDERKSFLFIF